MNRKREGGEKGRICDTGPNFEKKTGRSLLEETHGTKKQRLPSIDGKGKGGFFRSHEGGTKR